MSVYADYDVNALLVSESGRIGPDIYNKTLNTSVWMKMIKQGQWLDEFGKSVSVLTYERTLPSTVLSWNAVGFNPDNGSSSPQTGGADEGNCLPPVQVIPFAQTARSYNLQQTALESPPICVNDLRFPFQRKEQLSSMFSVLEQNTKFTWEDRYRNEYLRSCGHKVVAKVGLPENTTTTVDPNIYTVGNTLFPASAATSTLTQSIADVYALKLMRDGGGANPVARTDGMPVFGLICSPETSSKLILDNSDIRQDYRYVDGKAKELLAPLGIQRVYKNFVHMIDMMAPRYDWINGQGYIRRPYYASTAATYGNKWDVNPDYETAAYEVSMIFHADVMETLVPKPITAPGGNTKFDPVSYRGDFQWKNILNKTNNPDGTIGYFRAIYSSATKPVHPEWGYAIMHQRCFNPTLVACAAT